MGEGERQVKPEKEVGRGKSLFIDPEIYKIRSRGKRATGLFFFCAPPRTGGFSRCPKEK